MDLIVVFSALATVLAIFMFVSLRRTMRPLGVLSESALAISMGSDGMRTPVRSNSTDAYEIGSMAKSLERLRRSLVAAIERID